VSFDLGDPVPLSVTIRDTSGALANAGSVSVTITLPDATTVTQGPISPASTGVYNYAFPTVQVGRHSVRWVATGANAGASTDMFEVLPAAPPGIVSLADTKAHLNIPSTDTGDDAELAGFIRAATNVVENVVGPVAQRTVVESFHGGRPYVVLASPPLSVTSVTDFGTTLTVSDYKVNDRVLTKVAGVYPLIFLPGVLSVVVAYVAGLAATPPAYAQASLMVIQHMWETQRPAGRTAYSAQSDEYDPRYSYSVPRRALELLGEPIGGFA
jgi:hypothetical protein